MNARREAAPPQRPPTRPGDLTARRALQGGQEVAPARQMVFDAQFLIGRCTDIGAVGQRQARSQRSFCRIRIIRIIRIIRCRRRRELYGDESRRSVRLVVVPGPGEDE